MKLEKRNKKKGRCRTARRTGWLVPGRPVLGKPERRPRGGRLRRRRRAAVRRRRRRLQHRRRPVHAGGVLRSGPSRVDGRPGRRRVLPVVPRGRRLRRRHTERMVHERAELLRDAAVPERHLMEVHGHERRILGRRVLETGQFLSLPRSHLRAQLTAIRARTRRTFFFFSVSSLSIRNPFHDVPNKITTLFSAYFSPIWQRSVLRAYFDR